MKGFKNQNNRNDHRPDYSVGHGHACLKFQLTGDLFVITMAKFGGD